MSRNLLTTTFAVLLMIFASAAFAQETPDKGSPAVRRNNTGTGGGGHATKQWQYVYKGVIDSLGSVMYTSPLAVLYGALYNTDANLGSSAQTAAAEAHNGASNQMLAEQRFMNYVKLLPDGDLKIQALIECKNALMAENQDGGGGTQKREEAEAFNECMGGWITNAPDVDGEREIDRIAKVATRQNRSYPPSLEDETQDRNGDDPTCEPNSTTEECHIYSLWAFIYQSYRPELKVEDKSKWGKEKYSYIDEARELLGDVLFTEIPSEVLEQEGEEDEKVIAEKVGAGRQEISIVEPEVKTVKFAGDQEKNVDLGMYGLMFAQNLQDAYGSLYAVVYKRCEWENSINAWARSQGGAGFKASCPFWNEDIDADFPDNPSGDCTVNGGGQVFENDEEKMWPEKGDAEEWNGGRFYEFSESEETPTIHETLARLSTGTVQFSHLDLMMMWRIARAELEKDDDGSYECDDLLEGAALGDILDLEQVTDSSDPEIPMRKQTNNQGSASTEMSVGTAVANLGRGIKFNYTSLEGSDNKYRPATVDWPIDPEGEDADSTESEKGWLIAKRMQMFYDIANTVAFYRTYSAVNHWLSGLRQPILGNHRFKDKYQVAMTLVYKGINDTGHGNAISHAMLEADKALKQQRQALHDHVKVVESKASLAAAVKNTGQKTKTGSAGAGGNG